MSAAEDAAKFREECEECRAEAAKAANSSAKEQWLLFADEWLKLAQAAEELQRREALTIPTANVPAEPQ
jgi:hypothetical protein